MDLPVCAPPFPPFALLFISSGFSPLYFPFAARLFCYVFRRCLSVCCDIHVPLCLRFCSLFRLLHKLIPCLHVVCILENPLLLLHTGHRLFSLISDPTHTHKTPNQLRSWSARLVPGPSSTPHFPSLRLSRAVCAPRLALPSQACPPLSLCCTFIWPYPVSPDLFWLFRWSLGSLWGSSGILPLLLSASIPFYDFVLVLSFLPSLCFCCICSPAFRSIARSSIRRFFLLLLLRLPSTRSSLLVLSTPFWLR